MRRTCGNWCRGRVESDRGAFRRGLRGQITDGSASVQNFLVQPGGVPGVTRDPMPRIVQDAWFGISLPPLYLLQPFQQILMGMCNKGRVQEGGDRRYGTLLPEHGSFWDKELSPSPAPNLSPGRCWLGHVWCSEPAVFGGGNAAPETGGHRHGFQRRLTLSNWLWATAEVLAGCVCQLGCTDGCRTKPISRSGLYRVFHMRPKPYLGI